MDIETILNCVGILAGAFILLICILKAGEVLTVTHLVSERYRHRILLYLKLHRVLMLFFLIGYLVVMLSFIFDFQLVGMTLVSMIFLFGAIFVLMGITLQTVLLSEIQSTLRGLLPICLGCKKIRVEFADSVNKESWKPIEEYISNKANVDFTHGYCPDCFAKEIDVVNKVG